VVDKRSCLAEGPPTGYLSLPFVRVDTDTGDITLWDPYLSSHSYQISRESGLARMDFGLVGLIAAMVGDGGGSANCFDVGKKSCNFLRNDRVMNGPAPVN
jgi:hypothetical protein